jgi:hypothetical protein
MHNIKFVIDITFDMYKKPPKPETQNAYNRVQSHLHFHVSARKLRIMQFLGRTKLGVTLKCYKHMLMTF